MFYSEQLALGNFSVSPQLLSSEGVQNVPAPDMSHWRKDYLELIFERQLRKTEKEFSVLSIICPKSRAETSICKGVPTSCTRKTKMAQRWVPNKPHWTATFPQFTALRCPALPPPVSNHFSTAHDSLTTSFSFHFFSVMPLCMVLILRSVHFVYLFPVNLPFICLIWRTPCSVPEKVEEKFSSFREVIIKSFLPLFH